MHMTTMAAMPKDPQAPAGLNKCMEILKRIQLVWPSAARAWELLHGAKDDLPDYSLPNLSPEHRINKRTAEGVSISTSAAQVSDMRTSSLVAHSPYDTRFPDLGAVAGSAQSLSLYNSYERMPHDAAMGLPAGLSTSVLPQQYSTGFVDDRPVMHRSAANVDDGHGRYSQYWSDYSMGHPSSMLGSMYDLSVMAQAGSPHHERHPSGHVHAPPHPQADYQSATGSIYNIGNQYNVYPGSHLPPQ